MVFIVGSGPAGVAASVAMLGLGKEVTMLDAGLELEPERQQILAEMQKQPEGQWDADQVRKIKEGMSSSALRITLKMCYGSDYPFREAEKFLPSEMGGDVDAKPSLARGGLSTVWRAALMPYRAEDISNWPIGIADLADHYRAVMSFVKMSARHDDLETVFPLYTDRLENLEMGRQAESLMADMSKHREALRSEGIYFGASRLALEAQAAEGRPGCIYCGLCMYGCPYELIYSSAFTLQSLLNDKRFSYVKNAVVERVRETSGEVIIEGVDRLTEKPLQFARIAFFWRADQWPQLASCWNRCRLTSAPWRCSTASIFWSRCCGTGRPDVQGRSACIRCRKSSWKCSIRRSVRRRFISRYIRTTTCIWRP